MCSGNWEEKYRDLCRELSSRFTPGGSEFHMDPERCIRFAEEMHQADREFIKKTMRRINRSGLLRWLYHRAALRDNKYVNHIEPSQPWPRPPAKGGM